MQVKSHTIYHLHHLLAKNKLTKTFKVMEKTKTALCLTFQTNAHDGISKIYRFTVFITRTSSHCFRVAYLKTFTFSRHLPPEIVIGLRFSSASAVTAFLSGVREEIGADDKGKVITNKFTL